MIRDHLIGKRLESIKRLEYQWLFHFGAARLMVEDVWRLLSETHIVVTSGDDGQKFGLPAPVDAATELERAIGETPVTDALVDPSTSDLTICFGPSLRLQILNTSAGYEAWTFNENDLLIVGRNE